MVPKRHWHICLACLFFWVSLFAWGKKRYLLYIPLFDVWSQVCLSSLYSELFNWKITSDWWQRNISPVVMNSSCTKQCRHSSLLRFQPLAGWYHKMSTCYKKNLENWLSDVRGEVSLAEIVWIFFSILDLPQPIR